MASNITLSPMRPEAVLSPRNTEQGAKASAPRTGIQSAQGCPKAKSPLSDAGIGTHILGALASSPWDLGLPPAPLGQQRVSGRQSHFTQGLGSGASQLRPEGKAPPFSGTHVFPRARSAKKRSLEDRESSLRTTSVGSAWAEGQASPVSKPFVIHGEAVGKLPVHVNTPSQVPRPPHDK